MAGKTTLTNKLVNNYNFLVPKHITTREKRIDDIEGFYRYLSVDDFINLKNKGELLLYSGAGDRLYGILKEDCESCFNKSNKVLINISYKDIMQYLNINYEKLLIVLTYKNVLNGMIERNKNGVRKMSNDELYKRIIAAQQDYINYFYLVQKSCDCLIYTDEKDENETFESVKKIIKRIC